MGRPDESILLDIKGYKFKKANREKGNIHVISPNGANFVFDPSVFQELLNEIGADPNLAKSFGVK